MPACTVSVSVNSKGMRFLVERGKISVQVEVSVAMECPSQEISTSSLARANNLPPCIIRAMRLDAALAHKLAAWNERGLMRDLYDIYFLAVVLGAKPDVVILKARLSKVERRGKPMVQKMTVDDLKSRFEETAKGLTSAVIGNELRDYFTPAEFPGLDRKLHSGILRVIESL
jgi:hypothetical protein